MTAGAARGGARKGRRGQRRARSDGEGRDEMARAGRHAGARRRRARGGEPPRRAERASKTEPAGTRGPGRSGAMSRARVQPPPPSVPGGEAWLERGRSLGIDHSAPNSHAIPDRGGGMAVVTGVTRYRSDHHASRHGMGDTVARRSPMAAGTFSMCSLHVCVDVASSIEARCTLTLRPAYTAVTVEPSVDLGVSIPASTVDRPVPPCVVTPCVSEETFTVWRGRGGVVKSLAKGDL